MILKGNEIFVNVPITSATSKIRVKRRKAEFGEPISVRRNKLASEDYLGWQISYFLPLDKIWNKFRKSVGLENKLEVYDKLLGEFKKNDLIGDLKNYARKNVESPKKSEFIGGMKKIFEQHRETIILKERKDGKGYVSFELSDMINLLYEENIITKREIEDLIEFNTDDLDVENDFDIIRRATDEIVAGGFKIFEEKAPLLIKEVSEDSFVEIILKHEQKAVGYQSMVYFCTYLTGTEDMKGNSIIGRKARSKEKLKVKISKEDVFNIAKAFMIASKDHKSDMSEILKNILRS